MLIDGVSVTYGLPQRHILWTFAGGLSEKIVTTNVNHERYTCLCALNGTAFRMQQPPEFVGDNYFCESGNPLHSFKNTNTFQYTDDPLWDVKASAALTLTPHLGSVLCCPALPVTKLRYAFIQIKEPIMKILQLDCLRYMCSDRYCCTFAHHNFNVC